MPHIRMFLNYRNIFLVNIHSHIFHFCNYCPCNRARSCTNSGTFYSLCSDNQYNIRSCQTSPYGST